LLMCWTCGHTGCGKYKLIFTCCKNRGGFMGRGGGGRSGANPCWPWSTGVQKIKFRNMA
jgi:hypothetical protein